jgi:hypothetical protein
MTWQIFTHLKGKFGFKHFCIADFEIFNFQFIRKIGIVNVKHLSEALLGLIVSLE